MKKTADIICLTRAHLPIGATDPGVVEALQCLVEKATRGELLGIAVAYVEGNSDIRICIQSGSASAGLMVGAVGALNHEINDRWACSL